MIVVSKPLPVVFEAICASASGLFFCFFGAANLAFLSAGHVAPLIGLIYETPAQSEGVLWV